MKSRTSTQSLSRLEADGAAAARRRRVRQLERSLQARRDAGDRAGVALAAAWLAEARGAA